MSVIQPCSSIGWSKPHPCGPLLSKHCSLRSLVAVISPVKFSHSTILWRNLLGKVVICVLKCEKFILCVQILLYCIPTTNFCTDDFTLKEVRRATWTVRSKWSLLGSELGIESDTLQVNGKRSCIAAIFLCHRFQAFIWPKFFTWQQSISSLHLKLSRD